MVTKLEDLPAHEFLPCSNGLLHVPSRTLYRPTDRFFGLNAVDYPYLVDAAEPVAFKAFLKALFGDDTEAIETLQELFGLFLLPVTRFQKIALIVGPRRSGKGTIARVLTALVGRANVCSPTMASLGTTFGLAALQDKLLAIIADARISGRSDSAVVVERLLSISGEDAIGVDRKFRDQITIRLPVRFLILTNELPGLADASSALAGRFVLLRLTRSFYGQEDLHLTDKLLQELPGILNWSLDGWRRLEQRGHLIQPASSESSLQALADLGSPIEVFLREYCVEGEGRVCEVAVLYNAWLHWSEVTGHKRINVQTFGKNLRAARPSIDDSQPNENGNRFRSYKGIALKPETQTAIKNWTPNF